MTISPKEWYEEEIVKFMAGKIAARLAAEFGCLNCGFINAPTAYHEAGHAIAMFLSGKPPRGTVVYPNGQGVCVGGLGGAQKLPETAEDMDWGIGDTETIGMLCKWAKDDGFDLDSPQLLERTEKLLRDNWDKVNYYARNLMLNNMKLKGETNDWILEGIK